MSVAFMTALRYLAARKLRAALTTLAVVFGVAVIFAGNLVLPGALDSFRRASLGSVGAVDLSISTTTGDSFAVGQALDRATAVAGVEAASMALQRSIVVPVGQNKGQAVIIGVEPTDVQQVRQIAVAEGRFLQPGDTGVVVFGGAEARVGTTISLPTVDGVREFQVVGKLDTAGLPSSDVYMTLADAQAVLGVPGEISAIELALVPGANRAQVEADVLAALGPGFRTGATSAVDASGSLDAGYAMFSMLGALALFIGAFLIFNTFRTIVFERRRDLAMLRAIGAERGQVTAILLTESLIQGVLGSLLGLGVGALFAVGVLAAMRNLIGQFIPGVTIQVTFSLAAALPALSAGILTTLIAGFLPARAAGRVSPLEALRPATAAQSRKATRWSLIGGLLLAALAVGLLFAGPAAATGGALLFLVGLALASPALIAPAARLFAPLLASSFAGEGEIAQSNLRRQPGRAAVTASTLMIGLAAMVMIASLIGSFSQMITNLYSRSFTSDIVLLPQNLSLIGANLGANNQLADELRAIPGVAAVGTLRTSGGTLNGAPIRVNGIDPASYSLVAPLVFEQGEQAAAYAAITNGRSAIVNPILAAAQQLNIGDVITLGTPQGDQRYTIAGIGGDALSFKINTLFVSQANLAADFNANEDVMLMLKTQPGVEIATVQQQVTQRAAAYPQFTVANTASFRDQALDLAVGAMNAAFLPLALVILLPAMLGLLNTLTMSVLERTREIGITRAIGASQGQVRRIVVAEALLLGLLGATLGAVAGLSMSYGFTAALGGAFGVELPFSLPLLGVAAALVLGLGLTLLVSALPARTAARLDILRALRYE
ncbi:MAG: ABC transporter permease [Roseiflexaceae bacterium]|nr:ABC transporter permease [Roseiflexaceae bacterium]